jgi:hypothetical protein
MPTPTYVSLATITLGSTEADIVFSSIPATYRDLVLVVNGRTTDGTIGNFFVRFNSDTGSNYSWVRAGGIPAGPFSDTASTTAWSLGVGRSGDQNGNAILNIMDYSATDKHKTGIWRDNFAGTEYAGMRAGRWANTSAITTITITAQTGSLNSTTTLSLFGIVA